MERPLETVATHRHHFCAHGNTNVDTPRGNLVCDILSGFETGGTESVDGRSGSGIGEASGECGGADSVRGLAIRNLQRDSLVFIQGPGSMGSGKVKAYIAAANILHELGIQP